MIAVREFTAHPIGRPDGWPPGPYPATLAEDGLTLDIPGRGPFHLPAGGVPWVTASGSHLTLPGGLILKVSPPRPGDPEATAAWVAAFLRGGPPPQPPPVRWWLGGLAVLPAAVAVVAVGLFGSGGQVVRPVAGVAVAVNTAILGRAWWSCGDRLAPMLAVNLVAGLAMLLAAAAGR